MRLSLLNSSVAAPSLSARITTVVRAVGVPSIHKLEASISAFRRGFPEHTRGPPIDEDPLQKATSDSDPEEEASERTGSEPKESKDPAECKKKLTVAERDAELMEQWRERQGSLANAELEDGQVESGYRRNVKANIFRYI